MVRYRRGGTFTKEVEVRRELYNFCKIGSRIFPIIVEANPGTHMVSFIMDGKIIGSYKTNRRRMEYAINDHTTQKAVQECIGKDVLHLSIKNAFVFFEQKMIDFRELQRDFRRGAHKGLSLDEFKKDIFFTKEEIQYG